MADPIVGTIGTIATGLLGQKGANDRNEQQIAMTREQMQWQERLSNTALPLFACPKFSPIILSVSLPLKCRITSLI